MALWQLNASPASMHMPQKIISNGQTTPVIMIDDATGNIYIGGVNMSAAWSPSTGGGLSLITPVPTDDPLVYTLPALPKLLLLFIGGALQKAGAEQDFILSGNSITFNVAPGPGANPQAVVGY